MIGYVTLGTKDLARAATFYDALLGELGATRFMEFDRLIAWGRGPTQASLALALPFDGGTSSVGNGTMVALAVRSKEEVDRMHALALSLGGQCEGPPGTRFPGFYAGYFRDLDGNKLNFFYMRGASA